MTGKVLEQLGDEGGHVDSGLASLVAAGGAVALGIGSANDTGWLAVVGGVVLGLGIVAYALLRHRGIDYELYRRTENLK